MMMHLGKIDSDAQSSCGLMHDQSADQYLLADLSRSLSVHRSSSEADNQSRIFGDSQCQLAVVAGGIGPRELAPRASRLVLDGITHFVLNSRQMEDARSLEHGGQLTREFAECVRHCQQRLATDLHADGQEKSSGTCGATLTMGYITWPQLHLAHMGDSRCYLHRGGRLEQLTKDHTLAQRMLDQGVFTADKLQENRWTSTLWKAITTEQEAASADWSRRELALGDSLLLCTAGLMRCLSESQVLKVLHEQRPAAETCEKLLAQARRHDQAEDLTVILVRFLSVQQSEALAAQLAEEALTQEAPAPDVLSIQEPIDPVVPLTNAPPAE